MPTTIYKGDYVGPDGDFFTILHGQPQEFDDTSEIRARCARCLKYKQLSTLNFYWIDQNNGYTTARCTFCAKLYNIFVRPFLQTGTEEGRRIGRLADRELTAIRRTFAAEIPDDIEGFGSHGRRPGEPQRTRANSARWEEIVRQFMPDDLIPPSIDQASTFDDVEDESEIHLVEEPEDASTMERLDELMEDYKKMRSREREIQEEIDGKQREKDALGTRMHALLAEIHDLTGLAANLS